MSTVDSQVMEGSSTLSAGLLADWVDQLSDVDTNAPDPELIDQIRELERIKSACAAAQARLTVAFVASQTEGLPASKARDKHAHRSINAQVALARRDSPVKGGRHVGLAKSLLRDLPHTYAALQRGDTSEWRATLILRALGCLSAEDQRTADAELAGTLGGLGDRGTEHAATKIAQRLDPQAWVNRARKAASERRVSIRPAPDTMSNVTALLPVAHGVAVYAALSKYADCAKATGDPRSRGQLMADEFVTRITHPEAAAADAEGGNAATVDVTDPTGTRDTSPASRFAAETPNTASTSEGGDTENPGAADAAAANTTEMDDAPHPGLVISSQAIDGEVTTDTATNAPEPSSSLPNGINLDIQLIMTDRTLFDGDDEPAHLIGYGPIPAPLARRLVRDATPQTKAWIRRLYTDPKTGHLISGDTHRRFFNFAQRQFMVARDQTCRTPWCDAPIRHSDHVTNHSAGGPTDVAEGQGLCENCNHVKQTPGWTSRVAPNGHTITITTPTGHQVSSDPPRPPTSTPWAAPPTKATPGNDPPRIDWIFVEQRTRRSFELVG